MTLKFIPYLLLLLSLNSFGQRLKITLYNKTGYDLDSVLLEGKYVGRIKKNDSIAVLNCKKIVIQGGKPADLAYGIIKDKKMDDSFLGLCGVGCRNVTRGKFKFDITLVERKDGYRLFYNEHEN